MTRRTIAEAALEILDEDGASALTVRGIARRLGVQSPSLYNHVASKDEILDAVTELFDEGVDRQALADPDWRAGLAAFARSYRSAFRAHPAALVLIARRPVETAAALRVYDDLVAALRRAGWDAAAALRIAAALDYLVLGSALVPFSGGFTRQPAEYADRFPSLAASLDATRDAEIDDAAFEWGLSLLVEALADSRAPAP